MTGYQIHVGGKISSLTLTNFDTKPLAANEIRVKMHAASLNYRDLMIANSDSYPTHSSFVIPASDGAGEIIEIGAAVTRFSKGDRVITSFFPNWIDGGISPDKKLDPLGSGNQGALVEELVVKETALVKAPANLDYLASSTISCAGLTAWNALFTDRGLKPGSTVLLLGTGGVSIWALQLAKAAGLRVIITSSSDEKLSLCKKLGADVTINYKTTTEWHQEVLRITHGLGADLVVEVGGAETLARSVQATKIGGTVVIIGGVSGFGGVFEPSAIIGGARKLVGMMVGSSTQLEELVRFVELVDIKPVIDKVFPFAQAKDAYLHLESGMHFGKVVVQIA